MLYPTCKCAIALWFGGGEQTGRGRWSVLDQSLVNHKWINDTYTVECPLPQLGRRRCQCLVGPRRPRNNPSARAFLGLSSPNSAALVDHWHRPASGARGLDSLGSGLGDHPSSSVSGSGSVPLPRSHTSLLNLCSSSHLWPSSSSPYSLCTLSLPTLAPILSLLLARSLYPR